MAKEDKGFFDALLNGCMWIVLGAVLLIVCIIGLIVYFTGGYVIAGIIVIIIAFYSVADTLANSIFLLLIGIGLIINGLFFYQPDDNKPTYDYEYEIFQDDVNNFSFTYPTEFSLTHLSRIPDIKQNKDSSYSMYLRDIDLKIYVRALDGGIDNLKDDYKSRKNEKGIYLLKDELNENSYILSFKDGKDVFLYKCFYGNKTHQEIIIIYPIKYIHDENYQKMILKILDGFTPAVNIP